MKRRHSGLAVALMSLLLVACAVSSPTGSSLSAPPTPTENSPGMPAPILREDCRSLMGIIPVSAEDRYPNAWAFALRHSLLTEHANEFTYVGISVDEVVVYPSRGGGNDSQGLVEATVDRLAQDGFEVSQWRMGEARQWAFEDLCQAFDLLRGAMTGGEVVGIGPLDSGHLEVLVPSDEAASTALLSNLQARFPEMLVVTVSVGEFTAVSHRSNDTTGFNAGISIQTYAHSGWYPCSAAFKIGNEHGTFLLTAAHCSGASPQTVRNGTNLCWAGLSGNAYVGLSDSRILGASGDFAVIKGSPATTGRMWTGSACTGSGEVGVVGVTSSYAGATIGFSGHVSGHRTGTVQQSGTVCRPVTYGSPVNPPGQSSTLNICNLYRAMPTSHPVVVQGGDSGGPVFAYYQSSAVYAAGIIVASNDQTGEALYMSLPAVLGIYGADVVFG